MYFEREMLLIMTQIMKEFFKMQSLGFFLNKSQVVMKW